jgi:uncharacterized protein YggU (UPF0235/DUF167 family)
VGVLEWLLIIELVVLLLAGFLWVAGYIVSRTEPTDPMWGLIRRFWATMLHPPVSASEGSDQPSADSESQPGGDSPAEEPPEQAAASPDARTIRTAQLGVTVQFNSELDRLVGRDAEGLVVQVSASAEDTAGNRTVIQLVSSALGVKAYQVTLTRGHFQSKKGIAITGLSQDELSERIQTLFG